MSNYPRSRKDLALDPRQQASFDQHLHLVRVCVARYRKFVPPSYIDDLRQSLLVTLAKAALNADQNYHDPKTGKPLPFGPFAWRAILNCARNFCFGKNHRFENHALRNAERFERSADEPAFTPTGEPTTKGELAEGDLAISETQSFVASDHLASRRSEVREVIAQLKTLSAFERRVLKLRFIEGLSVTEIVVKTRWSKQSVGRALVHAIRKLREYYASKGLETLPLDAPIPRVDYEQAPNARRHA
jgi:RNA polymerase sigma factor (sigma-70 family)